MQITKIAEQVKNSNRVSVFVDERYCFSLNLDQLLNLKIKVGDEIDETQVKQFKKISADGKLKMRALEWLMIRPHSAMELRDYLRRKKVEPEQIKTWVKEFQNKKYQDDFKFCRWWIEQRRAKGRSGKYIKNELRIKGVSSEIINELLNNTNELEVLKQLITKKRHFAKYKDDKKLTEYLIRQGFGYSDIKELL